MTAWRPSRSLAASPRQGPTACSLASPSASASQRASSRAGASFGVAGLVTLIGIRYTTARGDAGRALDLLLDGLHRSGVSRRRFSIELSGSAITDIGVAALPRVRSILVRLALEGCFLRCLPCLGLLQRLLRAGHPRLRDGHRRDPGQGCRQIRFGLGHGGRGDGAAGARAVLDDHRLAEGLSQRLRDDARDDVRAAARTEPDQDADRTLRRYGRNPEVVHSQNRPATFAPLPGK